MGQLPEIPRSEMLPLTCCVKEVGEVFPSPQIKSPSVIVALQQEPWIRLEAYAI